jgi:biopolymer transport protein ExbD
MKSLTEQLDVGGDQADLTPLIDCVFLLLLFFIVTAVFVEETNLFQVELAEAEQSEVRRLEDVVVVWVSEDGRYALEQEYVPDDRLWPRLKALHERSPIQTLVIKGDRRSPLEKTVHLFDIARALGVPEVLPAVDAARSP